MRKKQLFALLMAGALSVGMAPTATFEQILLLRHQPKANWKVNLTLQIQKNLLKIRLKLLRNQPKIQPRHRKIRLKLLPKQQLILQRHRLLKKLMSRLLRQVLRL